MLLLNRKQDPFRMLGGALIAYWDAERLDTLVKDASHVVTSWIDAKGGSIMTQGTADARPVWGQSTFNGKAAVAFDGVDDALLLTGVPATWPTGAAPSEIWAVVDQTQAAGVAGNLNAAAYGGDAGTAARALRRVVSGGVNRGQVLSGDGAASNLSTEGTIDLSGRLVMRGIFTAAESSVAINGTASTPVASVPATGTNRARIGASQSSSGGGFWVGGIRSVLLTDLLTVSQAERLRSFLARDL